MTTTLEAARRKWQGRSHALDLEGIDFEAFRAQPLGPEVLRVGSPADLGWVGALFPLIGLAIVLGAYALRHRSVAVAPAE